MGGALSGRDLKDPAMTDSTSPRDDLVIPEPPPAHQYPNEGSRIVWRTGWREGWCAGRKSIPHAAEWWNAPGNITAPNGEVFYRHTALFAYGEEKWENGYKDACQVYRDGLNTHLSPARSFDEKLFDLARADDYEGIYRVMHMRKQVKDPDLFGRDLDARAAMSAYLSAMFARKSDLVPDMSAVAAFSFMVADAMATARSAK